MSTKAYPKANTGIMVSVLCIFVVTVPNVVWVFGAAIPYYQSTLFVYIIEVACLLTGIVACISLIVLRVSDKIQNKRALLFSCASASLGAALTLLSLLYHVFSHSDLRRAWYDSANGGIIGLIAYVGVTLYVMRLILWRGQ